MAAYTLKFIAGLLLFIISSTWLSVAQSHQEDKNSTTEIMAAFTHEKQEVLESASPATTADNKTGGRKMALHKHKVVRQLATKDGKWGSNMEYNQNKVGHFPQDHEFDDAAGFVAFNADYHAPKHHPPKNN